MEMAFVLWFKNIPSTSNMPNILSFDVGIKNLAYCVLESETREILMWNVCEIPTISIHKQIGFLDQCTFWEVPLDTVIIEKQPSRNMKMRTIENTLCVYFIMKGIGHVSTYSSKHKLGALGKSVKGVKNYNVRKKYGISMARAYVLNTTHHNFFEKHKKKDDLSDCLLQALAYTNYDMNQLQTSIILLDHP